LSFFPAVTAVTDRLLSAEFSSTGFFFVPPVPSAPASNAFFSFSRFNADLSFLISPSILVFISIHLRASSFLSF
jgi:hypothetical protein